MINTDDMVTAESGHSTDNEPVVDEFEQLISCLKDPEYFEKLESHPSMLLLLDLEFDKLVKLEETLIPILKQLQEASSFYYKLYVMNVALQIMDAKLNLPGLILRSTLIIQRIESWNRCSSNC
eukprot:XP_766559.1 hypothetical protein [Theileria parva strain Muguga]